MSLCVMCLFPKTRGMHHEPAEPPQPYPAAGCGHPS